MSRFHRSVRRPVHGLAGLGVLLLISTAAVANASNPVFSPSYIAANKDAAQFAIPETYELANIIISLTPYGKQANRIFQDSDYYRRVQAHFAPFATHPLIARLNLRDDKDFMAFMGFRENAAYWTFKGDRLVRNGPYRHHWDQPEIDGFERHVALIEDFATESDFRSFYRANAPYYDGLVADFLRRAPLASMIDWLEGRFGQGLRYDSYKVIFSPLVASSHSAYRGESASFRESLMFVGAPHIFGDGPLADAEIARMIFTEVDHNFVNPVSDRHKLAIDAAMSPLGDWNDQEVSGGYGTAYETFNEYMTWSVFSLWARETYPANVYPYVVKINQMDMIDRGFARFPAFDRALLKAVPQGSSTKVSDAYPRLIAFAREQQDVRDSDGKKN